MKAISCEGRCKYRGSDSTKGLMDSRSLSRRERYLEVGCLVVTEGGEVVVEGLRMEGLREGGGYDRLYS